VITSVRERVVASTAPQGNDEAFRAELRSWLAEHPPPAGIDIPATDDEVAAVIEWQRTLHGAGWVGIHWPVEHGGRGASATEMVIYNQELARAGAPPLLGRGGLTLVGPTLITHGTEEQRRRWMPQILTGEDIWCQLFSEPDAGSDLAGLSTRGEQRDGFYVVTGQKVWSSYATFANWAIALVRTDPDAPKHKGISILCVDTSLAGFKWTPIWTIGGGHTNATYYEDVRVPADMLVGEPNGGWKMITTQLNFERVSLGPSAGIFRNLDQVTAWAAATEAAGGGRVIDQEWVRLSLARVRAKAEVAELFNWQVAAVQETGRLNPADASAMKVYGTELRIESLRLLMEVLGPGATLKKGSPGAVLGGALEGEYRGAIVGTFGGGVNEIQREIVAAAGLRTPRVPR